MPAQYIQRLPAIFQTVTEKKFFDATFDQVFQKKDSDLLSGFLGRRNPGSYDPITDFYIPEPSKNRTWWQLEPTAYSRDTDTNKTNIFFYEDLLEHIEYYGGNTLNQDRLFESQYYSFGPPIDYDMFINYQNYYWVEQGLPVISISGVMSSDIIGKTSYVTPSTATPPNFKLFSGMTISLIDDPEFVEPHILQNFGGCVDVGTATEDIAGIGFGLVKKSTEVTIGTIFEFLPWDGVIELSTGRIVENRFWDMKTWEVQAQPGNGDYITIERGSLDNNAWSRTNKWYHISAINASVIATSSEFPINATRALRPIIQFVANIPLYNSGTQFRDEIVYGFRNNSIGQPLTLAEFNGQLLDTINETYDVELKDQDLISWFNDPVSNTYLWRTVVSNGIATFIPEGLPIVDGDIVITINDTPYDGTKAGSTWYYSQVDGTWLEVFKEKISVNQAPLFALVDHNGIPLDDPNTYPDSDFRGSEIFSYKVNTTPGATVDPVLKFPIVYKSLGQASDIVFENDLMTDRVHYVVDSNLAPIDGYYYYRITTGNILYNNWNLYDICDCNDIVPPPPCNCVEVSKQRVIDKFVVGYGSEFKFRLSVTPFGYHELGGPIQLEADINVNVNGIAIKNAVDTGFTFFELNNRVWIDISKYIGSILAKSPSVAPVVEAQTYTHETLDPTYPGYFEIPQQLEANPTQLEVFEISGSELNQHFASIIENQIGFEGSSFGGVNNYLNTRKNRSVGSYILQNIAPALKAMLIASEDNLDFIKGVRFSADEYTKFKNKFLSTALQLINQGFSALQVHTNTVNISEWVNEILKRLNISKEFSNAFAYSFMAAQGTPLYSEQFTTPGTSIITVSPDKYVDLQNPRNIMYIYDLTNPGTEKLLIVGVDYEILEFTLPIKIQLKITTPGINPKKILVRLYQDALPTYIPSTPTKVGAWGAYIPRIELDTTYAIPTNVIIGHDGSKTIAYNDYRDQLLLDLETRIYNGLQERFRNEYLIPLRLETIKAGYFRNHESFILRNIRYSRDEFLDVTESYLNKWTAKNRANYRVNDWPSASQDTSTDKLWKLYNYRLAVNVALEPTDLPGNWKGIFQYYYDTIYPDTRPWEMLGFSQQPTWWEEEYGAPILNADGQKVWAANAGSLHAMYEDLEAGIIRQGPSAIYNPNTLEPQPQETWARPGLLAIIPVDSAGEIIPIIDLFDLAYSGNPTAPFDHFDDPWIYGDGGPVEQAWMSTSGYRFAVMEFLYLMRPGPFGELLWDTVGTELSPGRIDLTDNNSPLSNKNFQYVQNDMYKFSTDPIANHVVDEEDQFFAWTRPQNKDQIVHAEIIDGVPQIRYGYQSWISDRILFLGKNITDTFGVKIRNLDVNLANKVAGFINKETTNTYISSVTPGKNSTSLIIPSNNFEVFLHKSPVVDTYSYSGVIVRTLPDGTFAVYGYDLLNAEFTTLNRKNDKLIDITIGGTPAEFRYFETGGTYKTGEIVRYNGVYYESKGVQTVSKFDPKSWHKLKGLPTVGGISVTYKPISDTVITKFPYGTILKTVQEVFDLMIGWGAWLESQGWQFTDVNQDTNMINDWLSSAKQFLFWLNTSWTSDSSIQVSPLANSATLIVKRGYPDDVEALSNGVYSILDKYGVAIAPNNTSTDRDGPLINVTPANLASGGIYFLQINASETEHVLIFDNVTSFNDVIYAPLLRARQQRLRFYGFRSNGWYGKMEAPGYLIIEDQIVPNYDTIVEAMRYYYDSNITIDNSSLEDLGRHLIGYESKSYLDNLEVENDVQYLFYQGVIRQKGTKMAFEKLFRSTKVQGEEIIKIYEEWCLKLGDFGNTVEQVSTEFKLTPEQNAGEVIVARLNYVPSDIGFVKQINILNAKHIYSQPPKIVISGPDAVPPIWTKFNSSIEYRIGDVVGIENSQGVYTYYKRTVAGVSGPFNLEDWTIFLQPRVAKAYAVLDNNNRISRVDMIDQGFGYLTEPTVTIDSGSESNHPDKLYAIWQGAILKDPTLDNIINIDIDDTATWTVRPTDPSVSLEFPLTDKIEYNPIPTAGYVNFGDVTLNSFDVNELVIAWGTTIFNPIVNDTIWIAKTFTEDWDVYKMLDISEASLFDVVENAAGELLLRTVGPNSSIHAPYLITTQLSGGAHETNFGNMLSLYIYGAEATALPPSKTATAEVVATDISSTGEILIVSVLEEGSGYDSIPEVIVTDPNPAAIGAIFTANIFNGQVNSITVVDGGNGYTNPIITIVPPEMGAGKVTEILIDKTGANYNVPPDVRILRGPGDTTGTGATAIATVATGGVASIIVTNRGSGYTSTPIIEIDLPLSVAPETNYTIAFELNQLETDIDPLHYYYSLLTLDGLPITATDLPFYASFTNLLIFKSMRFLTKALYQSPSVNWITVGDKVWIDGVDLNPPQWNVFDIKPDPIITSTLSLQPLRTQEKLIDTSLFKSATVFNDDNIQLVLLPVYDPFKYILPGPAKQNISYISFQDPARYNVTSEERLFSDNITFSEAQVGKLWWDLSRTRYVYYEQPIAQDGSETALDNLVYRRDHWAQLFPGSTVIIYEWTKSPVPPAEYLGQGIPRDITSYVQVSTSNRFTSITETNYYFWVRGSIDIPNVENRTMAAVDVGRLLQNPKSQGFSFFAPIQQTATNNSYMFYNVQEILAYKGNNVQVQYRISNRDDQEHTQWQFFREGDPNSLVTDQYWNKMVDSLCKYTKVLPVSDEWENGIIIPTDSSWYDNTIPNEEPESYGEILEVPDPTLSEKEKYGIQYRPLQGMFVDLQMARKIFVQAGNEILKHIPIRDYKPSWADGISTNYWTYQNWYKAGYENVLPTVVFQTKDEADLAVAEKKLPKGTIVQVIDGKPETVYSPVRYVLYAVIQPNPNLELLSLEEVGVENSSIKLLDTIYTIINSYGLSVELRELLNAFRTEVMIDEFLVDQNELFFSLVNYVLSEQRTPDWVFKTSYIYIKEDNIPLTQAQLYVPDQIGNIIDYIKDVKPYHVKIRDYTSVYTIFDEATGTAIDTHKFKIKIKFGPNDSENRDLYEESPIFDPMVGWDYHQGPEVEPWDTFAWDHTNMANVGRQIISRNSIRANYPLPNSTMPGNWPGFDENTIQVPITEFNPSKVGYSHLYPYNFNFDSINIDNPQTFITPHNIVAMKTSVGILYYGHDYYVEYNESTSDYTVFFFNDPGADVVAFVWLDGGAIQQSHINGYRNELAAGTAEDHLVINVDTRLPVSEVDGNIVPYSGWGNNWDSIDASTTLGQALVAAGAIAVPRDGDMEISIPWDGINAAFAGSFTVGVQYIITSIGTTDFTLIGAASNTVGEIFVATGVGSGTGTAIPAPIITDATISYKHHTNVISDNSTFYRNAHDYSGTLVNDLLAPISETYNIDVITIFVDPATHPNGTDILPNPTITIPGTIWIDGERIEYMHKEADGTDTWALKLIRRGADDTAPTDHLASSTIWVEEDNIITGNANNDIWNVSSLPGNPDLSSQQAPGQYSSVTNVATGGLWYASTPEAIFLKEKPGQSNS